MPTYSWSEATIITSDLWLDALNPRIDVKEDATQEEIRLQLLEYEEIIELANDIIKEKRLLPGDRIIIFNDGGKYVVLEGNRRVCACQMLLDPTLIPTKYEKRFPKADSEDLILSINQIKVDIAPARKDAEYILTKRHTEPGIRKWTPIAKMRRAARWYIQGKSINNIAKELYASVNNIKKSIRDYNLLQFILNIPSWSKEDLLILRNEKLSVSPFTRFFTLAQAKERLKLDFDDDECLKSNLPKDKFEALMQCIAMLFLIPEPGTNKPWANTRTKVEDIFAKCNELLGYDTESSTQSDQSENSTDSNNNDTNEKLGAERTTTSCEQETNNRDDQGQNKENTQEKSKEEKHKENNNKKPQVKARFFENINCQVSDQRLIQLCLEIKLISYTRMPMAATMLLRALLESSLAYHLIRIKKWDELIGPSGVEPGLQKIISFCIIKEKNVFKNKRARDILNVFNNGFKDIFDIIVHSRWADANPTTLEQAASMLRPLINYILNHERLGGLIE